MKMTRILTPVLAPLAFAVSVGASAGGAGYPPPPPPKTNDIILRIGGTWLNPHSDQVTFIDSSLEHFDGFRTTLDPDTEWGWNVSGVWKPMDHWGIELNYSDVTSINGGNARGFFAIANLDFDFRRKDLAEFDASTSSAIVNWYPLDPSCQFQPYVGVGLNYTDFSSEKFRGAARRDLRDFGVRSRLSMGYSWGASWQIGADIYFGRQSPWLVNVAAIYAQTDTDISFSLRDNGTVPLDGFFEAYSGDYHFNPWMFNLAVGYKFEL